MHLITIFWHTWTLSGRSFIAASNWRSVPAMPFLGLQLAMSRMASSTKRSSSCCCRRSRMDSFFFSAASTGVRALSFSKRACRACRALSLQRGGAGGDAARDAFLACFGVRLTGESMSEPGSDSVSGSDCHPARERILLQRFILRLLLLGLGEVEVSSSEEELARVVSGDAVSSSPGESRSLSLSATTRRGGASLSILFALARPCSASPLSLVPLSALRYCFRSFLASLGIPSSRYANPRR
mmetsp:Transcript_29412/g.57593  ORF Transcript_29412/g.57593 Transcript_29412/m.57593 type:complete len:241 (+) Transcript_29412:2216-2938(+)